MLVEHSFLLTFLKNNQRKSHLTRSFWEKRMRNIIFLVLRYIKIICFIYALHNNCSLDEEDEDDITNDDDDDNDDDEDMETMRESMMNILQTADLNGMYQHRLSSIYRPLNETNTF